MTAARAELVDPNLTRWYHCVVRCVRRADLLGEGDFDRKQWIEDRLEALAHLFAVSVGGFAVLDNQVHILARLNTDVAAGWSNAEVLRRWGRLVPPRDKARQPLPAGEEWVRRGLRDASLVASARQRLASLSWFMKSLKEPLSRMVNREEGARGAFFEGRFKSVAILDAYALLAACAYIDVAPVVAGLAAAPKVARYTSLRRRAAHAAGQRRAANQKAAKRGAAQRQPPSREDSLWLCPIEDCRDLGSTHEGMFVGFTLADYLLLVDYTGRMLRDGTAPISRELRTLFTRLGSDPESWHLQMLKLSEGRLLGRFFAASRERLREVAEHLGVHHLANLGSCPTR